MKALVTGTTGFIGGALVMALTEAGWQVNVLVRPGSRHKLGGSASRCRVIEAELPDRPDVLRAAVADCDVVFHAAAIRNRWGTPPEAYRQVNVEGTRCLLDAASGRVGRLVYVSSVGVLGRPGVLHTDETFPVIPYSRPFDYHTSKAEAEKLVLARASDMPVVVVRPTITYGPGDRDGMLTRLIEMMAQGHFVRIGSGRNHLHLTCIADLVQGLLLAATHPHAPGQTFILAGPQPIQVRVLLEMIERQLCLQPIRWFVPEALARVAGAGVDWAYRAAAASRVLPSGHVPPVTAEKIDTLCANRGFSFAAAQRVLGYNPRIGYADGLARTVEWMSAQGRISLPQAAA